MNHLKKRSFDKTPFFKELDLSFVNGRIVLYYYLIKHKIVISLKSILNKTEQKMGRFLGYARVSRDDQNLELQINALLIAGCQEALIFTDKVSGAKSIRPGLDQCLEELKAGDTLIQQLLPES